MITFGTKSDADLVQEDKIVSWVGPGDFWSIATGADIPNATSVFVPAVESSSVRSFYDFGAIGDGVANDTASLLAALESGKPLVQQGGVFKILSEIVVTNAVNLAMSSGAKIVLAAGSGAARALHFSASGNVVAGLSVEGDATAEVVRFSGANNRIDCVTINGLGATKYGLYLLNPQASVVNKPSVRNCMGPSTVYPAIGLFAKGEVSGLQIIDPEITDIVAPKVGSVGESPGAARAIKVETDASSGHVLIRGGVLARVTGREGDALHIQSSGSYDAFVARIVGTEIVDCDRRAVKTQCGVSRIYGVVHKTVALAQEDIPIGVASINTFSEDVEVSCCDVDARFFDFGIVVNYSKKGRVENNTVKSGLSRSSDPAWSGRSSQVGIYIGTAYGTSAKNNTVDGGYYGIRAASAYEFSIDENHIYGSKWSHIYIDDTADNGHVKSNRFYDRGAGNVGSYGVHSRGSSILIEGNTSLLTNPGTRTHYTVYVEAPASKNTVSQNTSNASYNTIFSTVPTGNRVFGNANIGTGGVGAISVIASAGDEDVTAPAAPYAGVVYKTPITADRTVLLSGYPEPGDTLRVTRTAAATGAFSVIVGASLKSLGVGQWVELIYSGTAWEVTAAGAL